MPSWIQFNLFWIMLGFLIFHLRPRISLICCVHDTIHFSVHSFYKNMEHLCWSKSFNRFKSEKYFSSLTFIHDIVSLKLWENFKINFKIMSRKSNKWKVDITHRLPKIFSWTFKLPDSEVFTFYRIDLFKLLITPDKIFKCQKLLKESS